MNNASTEGFNNKIRRLIHQAYGFRNITYLKLKIFQLPSIYLKNNHDLWLKTRRSVFSLKKAAGTLDIDAEIEYN